MEAFAKRKWRLLLFLFFGCVVFYIGYQVPYCHDEWQWGLQERIDLMKTGFRDYNGRYLGNLLALVITRSVFMKAAVFTFFTLWLIDVLYQNLFKKETRALPMQKGLMLLGIFLLIYFVPRTLFAQSYGWSAAFVNFVPPAVLFLVYYNWTESLYDRTAAVPEYTGIQTAAAFFLGVSTQLFSENITVFVVIYAGWILVLSWIRFKKVFPVHIIYFTAAAAGAVLMFSNGAYHNAATGQDSYKHIEFSLKTFWDQYCSRIAPDLFLNNWILNLLIAGLLLYFIIRTEKFTILTAEISVAVTGYGIYSVFHKIYPAWRFSANTAVDYNSYVNGILGLLFFVHVLLGIWLFVDTADKYGLMALWISVLMAAGPLVAANPIGVRCFFITYMFQCLMILKLLVRVLPGRKNSLCYGVYLTGIAVVAMSFFYVWMFRAVGEYDRLRRTLISNAVETESQELVLPLLPYSEYFWTTVPANETWEKRFREFYGVPDDIVLRFEQE